MKRQKMTVTIQDVASRAGVSISTVSRVLNRKQDVSEQTYARVQHIIGELGYTSSLAARCMRSQSTNVLGVTVPFIDDEFITEIIKGVSQAALTLAYDLMIYTSGMSPDARADRERRNVSLLNGSITDGMIIVTPKASTFATSFPLVAIDPHSESLDFPAVSAANYEGALCAIDYLIELGHRHIGFVSGPMRLRSALSRMQGYKDGLRKVDIPIDLELIQTGDYSRKSGRACARRLLSLPRPPTAIFAANDMSAIGVIEMAHEMGFQVPQTLSVVGFDDIPSAAYCRPGLTTMAQPFKKMGYTAVKMLVDLVQEKGLESKLVEIPTQLIVRDSCRAIV